MTYLKKRVAIASLLLIALLIGVSAWGFYIWRFDVMRDFRWEIASPSWVSRINAPINTDYPFDCSDGQLGRSTHKIHFANMPSHEGNPLLLVIEDAARADRVVYKGAFAQTIELGGIQFCDRTVNGQLFRSYEQAFDAQAQMHFGSFHFIIYDPKAGMLNRAFAEAPSPLYSASEATIELYPFVRQDVQGRYATRIDTPLHTLPEWYQNPRLYSDPF